MIGFYAAGAMGQGGVIPPTGVNPFFASDPITTTGWEPVSYPNAIYDAAADATYVAWQFVGLSGYKGVHVAAYNHASSQWSPRYTAGNFQLANDDHGHPALVIDADGYIHCLYGSHAGPQRYSVSNAPNDVSTWTQFADFGSTLTYPKPVLVGSTIYLFAREQALGNSRRRLSLQTMTPTAGVGSFGSPTIVLDFGADSRVYQGEAHAIGTEIHFVCTRANSADSERKGVYYFVYDTSDGSMSNYNGSVSVASGDLPVDLTEANADFRIFDHGSDDGDVPSLQFDSSGNAHVLFANGSSPSYDLDHMMLSGGSWSSPVTVAVISDLYPSVGYVDTYNLVPGASGKMEAWYNVSGDKVRRVRSAGGTWASAETIKAAGTYDFVQGAAVANAQSDLRTIFSESSGSALDSSAALMGLYGYGDSGAVGAIDMSPQDPVGFNNVVLLLGGRSRSGVAQIIDESKSTYRAAFAGNAQISAAQTPFAGGGSLVLDGNGDYLNYGSDSTFSLHGTSDWCIDGWVRRNDTGRLQCIASRKSSGATVDFNFVISASDKLQFLLYNSSTVVVNITGPTSLTTGAWYFVEVSRVSGTVYVFLNGTLEGSAAQSATPALQTFNFLVGRDALSSARDFNGWISDFRLTKGAGRHTTSYSVPTTWAPRQ